MYKNIDRNAGNLDPADTSQTMSLNTYPRPPKYFKMTNGLRSVEEIPSVYRHIFSQFSNFNRMQSDVMNDALYSEKSIVLSAPTGSGKTVIFELAIIQLLKQLEDAKSKENYKIIYMAPIKALCNEITADWKKKFERLDLSCVSVTGDDYEYDMGTSKCEIIITTPEKWDSLSRKWNGNIDFMKTIKLFMIDEVHLLNEDRRGPILETVVSRMKTIRTKLNKQENVTKKIEKIRFVAVSATIPNIEDLATWLDTKENTVYHKISDELRPVKLEKHVIGYHHTNQTAFKFDMNLTYQLPSIIRKYSNNKPVLIFCSSRKSTEMAANTIVDKVQFSLSDEQRDNLSKMSNQIKETKLRTVIASGIAFHHAGLCVSDRKLIEDNFRSSSIPVLCSTNTLAMGVNLPAYLVIIKSTEIIVPGGALELSEAALLQMMGRAGRPQFDVHGVAVIMTQNNKVKQYENLITGTAPIESHLHKHLVEHLNSEIVSQTISTVDLAVQWIRTSYLYIRAIQNPQQYDLPMDASRLFVEKKMEDLCVAAIDELVQYGLVIKENSKMKATELGRLMAHYYLNFRTMKHFKKITGTETIEEIFGILISCPDYLDGYHLRVDDKRVLNDLNGSSKENELIRFPIKGKVKTATDKISCLVQAVFGNIPIVDQSLTEEAAQMIKLGQRLGRAMQDYIATMDSKYNFRAYTSIMLLLKAFHVNLWENSTYVFKQCKKIGLVYSKILQSRGRTSFESVVNAKASDIEMILRKSPPFGSEFLESISLLPRYTLDMELKDENQVYLIVKQINPKFVSDPTSKGVSLVVGDSTNETLFINHNLQYYLLKYGKLERTMPLKNASAHTVTGHLIHNGIVGLDKSAEIILHVNESSIIELSDNDEPKPKASKRKSAAKSQKKQAKMSRYLSSPNKSLKRSSKRLTNSDIAEKKKKNDKHQLDGDVMNGNDVMDWIELYDETIPLNELCKVPDEPEVPTLIADVDLTIEPIQQSQIPKKKAFTLNRPSESLKKFLSTTLYDDIYDPKSQFQSNVNNNETKTDAVLPKKSKFTFIIISSKNQKLNDETETHSEKGDVIRLHATELKVNEPITIDDEEEENVDASTMMHLQDETNQRKIFHDKNDAYIDLTISNDQTRTTVDTTKLRQKLQLFDDDNNQPFAPSCVKTVFANQTQPFPLDPIQKEDMPKKKKLNFSYDHLLTQLTPPKATPDSHLISSRTIDKQRNRSRIPYQSKATVIPFRSHYINDFSAEKELNSMEQMNYAVDKTTGISMFSLSQIGQINLFCEDTSLDDLLIEQRELNERQKRINEQIDRRTHNSHQLPATTSNRLSTNSTDVLKSHQFKKGISMIPTDRSGYEPTNSNLLSVDPFESFSSQADRQLHMPSTQRWNKGLSMIPNDRSGYEPTNSNLLSVDPFESFSSQADRQLHVPSTQRWNKGLSMIPNDRFGYEPTYSNLFNDGPFESFSSQDYQPQIPLTQQWSKGISMIPNDIFAYESTNSNILNVDPLENCFSQADHQPQIPSTQQRNKGLSSIPNDRFGYEPTNFNFVTSDPYPNFFSQTDHYHTATQNLVSSNRSQYVNLNDINRNDYQQPSQISSFIPNRTGNNMDTFPMMNYNYKPSSMRNTFSSSRDPYFVNIDHTLYNH